MDSSRWLQKALDSQIFSQLADKFYIVLMVFLIAQYRVSSDPQSYGALGEIALGDSMDIETRAERITLLATGIYVANTLPAILLGMLAGVWADSVAETAGDGILNAMRRCLCCSAPFCPMPGPFSLGLSWGYRACC